MIDTAPRPKAKPPARPRGVAAMPKLHPPAKDDAPRKWFRKGTPAAPTPTARASATPKTGEIPRQIVSRGKPRFDLALFGLLGLWVLLVLGLSQ